MWDGYFTLGGNEIGNSARTIGYQQTSDCPVRWIDDIDCGGISDVVGEPGGYNYDRIDEAPWYDPDDPETTSRFLGLYVVDILGLSDSTRSAVTTEKITAGAQVSGCRHRSRDSRVRALLTAKGMDALEAGMTWLRSVLEPNACGVHGGDCGAADMQFFVDCPPAWDGVEPIEEYRAEQERLKRFLHGVTCISGPIVQRRVESKDGLYFGYLVEFTLLAAVPFVYGATKTIAVPPTTPTVMQDVAYNLVPYPSAEAASGTVVVATNLSTNPSVEANATGWTSGADGVAITGAMLTAGQVTGELAAVGVDSYRVVFTASGAGVNGHFYAQQDNIALSPAVAAGARFSVNIWAAELVMAGAPVRGLLEVLAIWRSSSGGTVLRTDTLGTIPLDGGYVSVPSIEPPAGATHVLIRVRASLTSWPAGTVMRLYADALAVTNP